MLFDEIPYLKNDKILLRQIVENDLDDLWAIYSNPAHFRYTLDTSTKNKETLRKRIGHFQRDFDKKKRLFLALEYEGKLIGILEAFDYKKRNASVTVGYRLQQDYWGKGLASQALQVLSSYLLKDCQLHTLQAYVMPENLASRKVLAKNSFQESGQTTENWKGLGEVEIILFSHQRRP